jgi:hypothetical protein
MPISLNADIRRGICPCTEPDHRAIGLLAIHAGEEYLVIGHAVLRKIKTFRFVGQFIDGKLPFLKHLFPGKAQNLECREVRILLFLTLDRL